MIKEYLIQYTGTIGEVLECQVTKRKFVGGSEGWGAFKIKCTEKELDEMEKQWNKLSNFFVKEIHDTSRARVWIWLHKDEPEKPSIYKVCEVNGYVTTANRLCCISEIVEFLKSSSKNRDDYKDFLTSDKPDFCCSVDSVKLKEFLEKKNTVLKNYFNNF